MKKPNQPTKKPPRQTKKSQTHQKSQILVAFHNLCFILPQSTWPNSHWHPFVLPHPPKYSMVAARFEWVLNGAEGGDQVWLPWPPLPAPNFSRIIPFPTSSPCWCHPCAASGAPAGWAGQGELGKWLFLKCFFWLPLTVSLEGSSLEFWMILAFLEVSEEGPISLLPFCAGTRSLPGSEAGGAGMPQLLFFPSWKWIFGALQTQLMSWGSEHELQWDFVLIFVFLLKKKVIISVFESIGPWVFQE